MPVRQLGTYGYEPTHGDEEDPAGLAQEELILDGFYKKRLADDWPRRDAVGTPAKYIYIPLDVNRGWETLGSHRPALIDFSTLAEKRAILLSLERATHTSLLFWLRHH